MKNFKYTDDMVVHEFNENGQHLVWTWMGYFTGKGFYVKTVEHFPQEKPTNTYKYINALWTPDGVPLADIPVYANRDNLGQGWVANAMYVRHAEAPIQAPQVQNAQRLAELAEYAAIHGLPQAE